MLVHLVACSPTCGAGPSAGPLPSCEDEEVPWNRNDLVWDDTFSWGEVDEEGFSFGLRVDSTTVREGDCFYYWLSVANYSGKRQTIRLSSGHDSSDGTWLGARRSDGSVVRLGGAVGSRERLVTSMDISMELYPGSAKQRRGNPIRAPAHLVGEAELVVVSDTRPWLPFETRSGSAWIEVLALEPSPADGGQNPSQ